MEPVVESMDELAAVCPGASPWPALGGDAVDGVMPEVVVFPGTSDEVAAAMRLAAPWLYGRRPGGGHQA